MRHHAVNRFSHEVPGQARDARSPETPVPGLTRDLAVALALALALPGAALAQSCTFTTECYETEACADTRFDLTLTIDGIETEFGTAPLAWSSVTDTSASYLTSEAGALNLLTVTSGGARYAVTLTDGPELITYHGTCEGF